MNKLILFAAFFSLSVSAISQKDKKTIPSPTAQPDMNKLLEDAMNAEGMSKEEKEEMKKLMKDLMPALAEQNAKTADYGTFTSNKELVPKKDLVKINALSKKQLSQADISSYAANLYNKLLTKGDAAQTAIVRKVIAQTPGAKDIGGAAILAMLQGYPQAAMALSMKAVQADPSNATWQNNMASLLTQYGYPEQAIPVLQKLKNQFPGNSTVLNNMAYAWLGLGETDSARIYSGYAMRSNSAHSDALNCGGLMEELNGDPIKATDQYVESMENGPNPFTETLINNNKGQSKLEKIDYEKIKRSIAIYEYFPRDWMANIPLLSGTVNNYADDYATQKGYDEMSNRLQEKIDTMTSELSREVEDLAEKGEEEFVKTMAKETMKGLSFMSKPAVTVLRALSYYQKEWLLAYGDEVIELNKLTDVYKNEYNAEVKRLDKIVNPDHNVICKLYDAAANKYMQAVNPLFKKFFTDKAEEFRQWINAYVTWNWYVAGNPKNVILIQDLGFVSMLKTFYVSAVETQVTMDSRCKSQRVSEARKIAAPEIPNFTCPAVVSIPMGAEWQQLNRTDNNFDNNNYGIKNNPASPVPNHTIAYGADRTSIPEPGQDPFISVANGTISPGIASPDITNAAKTAETLSNYREKRSPEFKPDLSTPGKTASSVTDDIVKVTRETSQQKADAQKEGDWVREYLKNKIASQKAREQAQDQAQADWFREYLKSKIEKQKAMEAQDQAQAEWFREYLKRKIEAQKQKDAQIEKNMERFREYLKQKLEAQKIADKNAIDRAIDERIKQAKKSKLANELLKKMMTADCKNVRNTKEIQKELFEKGMREAGDNVEDLQANGLLPSLSSGLQAPGTFTPVKGLFN